MTGRIARLVLLVLLLAFLVNVAKGQGKRWLNAKFLGKTAAP